MGMGKQRDLVVANTWKRIRKNLATCLYLTVCSALLDGLHRAE